MAGEFLHQISFCWHPILVGGFNPLKNISQLGWLFPMYGKIKNVQNHQSELFLVNQQWMAGEFNFCTKEPIQRLERSSIFLGGKIGCCWSYVRLRWVKSHEIAIWLGEFTSILPSYWFQDVSVTKLLKQVISSYNVRPPFENAKLVNITPISLWFMVRK